MDKQDSARLDAILDEVASTGLLTTPRHVPSVKDDDTATLEGEICIDGRRATLRLVLDASFPQRLPRLLLRPWDAFGMLPHVDRDGLVCYADREGLVLNRRRPGAVAREAILRALAMLADGVAGRNREDFADEWESYWRLLPGGIAARSVLDPEVGIRWVIVATGKEGVPWIAEGEDEISSFLNGQAVGGNYTLQRVLYLPLAPAAAGLPPHPDRPFWTVDEARRALLPALSAADQRRLPKLLKGRARAREFVVAGLARPSGGFTLFGLRYDGVGERHPLLPGGTAERLVPIRLERLDRAYLVPRGGGDLGLGGKRVLLVGCGAVGGHLAFELARAGVLDLTLVDHDLLTPENSFRHALGRSYWWVPKAEALKRAIEAALPYTTIRAVTSTIEGAVADGTVDLAGYDLVVLALGNPTVELALNERLHALPAGPAAIFTWLEPLGIGGHALLAGNAGSGGCFECLYTPPEDDAEPLANRAAFAEPGKSYARALSGCGSLFTPYGSIDAVRTAALAARLAIDALTGREAGNPLLSWKGNATAFEDAGYRLSPRHGLSEDDLHRLRYAYRTVQCPICGARIEEGP